MTDLRLWADSHTGAAMTVAGVVLLLVLSVIVRVAAAARRTPSDRLAAGIAGILTLAWMSEGHYEVVRGPLDLPWYIALLGCAVWEAMLLAAYLRAEAYRSRSGVPGPSGTTAWMLAVAGGLVAALAASSPSEVALRILLPVMAVRAVWDGLVAPRDTDTAEMRARQGGQAESTTWAITPRSLLVALGLMRPGHVTVTAAERERQIRRMVDWAERAVLTRRDAVHARATRKLRALARTADEEMMLEVRQRVDRARASVALLVGEETADSGAPEPVEVAHEQDTQEAPDAEFSPWDLSTPAAPVEPAPPVEDGAPAERASAVQKVRQEERSAQELESVVCATRKEHPEWSHRKIAGVVKTSPTTVRRILERAAGAEEASADGADERASEMAGAAS